MQSSHTEALTRRLRRLALTASCALGAILTGSAAWAQYQLGQITAVGENFCPHGMLPADGRSLPVASYRDLYLAVGCLWGTGCTNMFPLPDLRGRVLTGADSSDPAYRAGTSGGRAEARITASEMPPHSHALVGSSAPPTQASPEGHAMPTYPQANARVYSTATDRPADAHPGAVGPAGQGMALPLLQPGLAVNYCVVTSIDLAQ